MHVCLRVRYGYRLAFMRDGSSEAALSACWCDGKRLLYPGWERICLLELSRWA